MKNFRVGQKVVFNNDRFSHIHPTLRAGVILTVKANAHQAVEAYFVHEFIHSSIYAGYLEALPETD